MVWATRQETWGFKILSSRQPCEGSGAVCTISEVTSNIHVPGLPWGCGPVPSTEGCYWLGPLKPTQGPPRHSRTQGCGQACTRVWLQWLASIKGVTVVDTQGPFLAQHGQSWRRRGGKTRGAVVGEQDGNGILAFHERRSGDRVQKWSWTKKQFRSLGYSVALSSKLQTESTWVCSGGCG